MLRRTLAAIVLGPALFAASLAWSGFTAQRTVLDPDRSEQIATDLYDDPDVRERLVANTTSSLAGLLPEGVEASDDQLAAAANRLLDDSRVRGIVVGTFVQSHRAFLGETEAPTSVDLGVVGVAARDALVGIRPDLATALPEVPPVVIDLPTDRIPNASPVRTFLSRAVPILALIAVGGVVLALFTTSHRPSVLRRAGWWAVSAAAFVLVVGFGAPYLARLLLPDQAEVFAAIVGALLAAVLTPSIVLAVCGAALVAAAMIWGTTQRLATHHESAPAGRVTGAIDMATPSPAAQPAQPEFPSWNPTPAPRDVWAEAAPQRTAAPAQAADRAASTMQPEPLQPQRVAPSPAGSSIIDPNATSPIPTAAAAAGPNAPASHATAMWNAEPEATQLISSSAAAPVAQPPAPGLGSGADWPPATAAPAGAVGGAPAPRWREGIGWVQHPDDPRQHPGATWQPGIGYVLPGPIDNTDS